jgi:cell division topological specificity factor
VIPESGDVLNASNKGEPVILDVESAPARPMTTPSRASSAKNARCASPRREEGLLQQAVRRVSMGLFDFLGEEDHRRNRQEPPADHHRPGTQPPRRPDYLPLLQRELLEVIKKYVNIDVDAVKVDLVKEATTTCWTFPSRCPKARHAEPAPPAPPGGLHPR